MELLWVPFSFAAIFLWGVGQVFAKETRSDVHSSNLLLLFAANIAVINIAYWLVFRESGAFSSGTWFQAAIAAALSGAAYVTYYESLKHGKVSVVGTIAGAYAPWTVFLAIVFLGEDLSIGQTIGIVLVVAAMLIFTYPARNGNGNGSRKTELLGIAFAIASLFFWGTSAAMAKGAIDVMGNTNFIGLYGLVCPPIWLAYWFLATKGKLDVPKADRRILELSLAFIALGGVTMYLAIGNGPVAIVTPITNLYPMLTIAVAKFRLREQLSLRQGTALAMLLGSVPLFSI